jgi:2-phosphoglycerate kinase
LPKVILVGGTSHAGKSTLAAALAGALGYKTLSTDQLARHPGRPWLPPPQEVPPHVRDHYATHDVDELMASVCGHYSSMQPLIRSVIEAALEDRTGAGLVLEGSALLPLFVSKLRSPAVGAVCLVANDDLLQARILAASGYEQRLPAERLLIDRFVGRTLAFNHLIAREATDADVPTLALTETTSMLTLTDACLAVLRR